MGHRRPEPRPAGGRCRRSRRCGARRRRVRQRWRNRAGAGRTGWEVSDVDRHHLWPRVAGRSCCGSSRPPSTAASPVSWPVAVAACLRATLEHRPWRPEPCERRGDRVLGVGERQARHQAISQALGDRSNRKRRSEMQWRSAWSKTATARTSMARRSCRIERARRPSRRGDVAPVERAWRVPQPVQRTSSSSTMDAEVAHAIEVVVERPGSAAVAAIGRPANAWSRIAAGRGRALKSNHRRDRPAGLRRLSDAFGDRGCRRGQSHPGVRSRGASKRMSQVPVPTSMQRARSRPSGEVDERAPPATESSSAEPRLLADPGGAIWRPLTSAANSTGPSRYRAG